MRIRTFLLFFPCKKVSHLIKLVVLAGIVTLLIYLFLNEKTGSLHFSKTIRTNYYEKYRLSLKKRDVNLPGEEGKDVILTEQEQKTADALFKREAFNIIASNKVAMDRTVPDTRDPKCASLRYPEELPSASVIIIFHNEAWSPLIRTVHSVVNRSPWQYLKEVVLLDDASYRPELGTRLEKYIEETWPEGIVRLVRKRDRQGLIRARLEGAKAAVGDVIIFLDSHCEANTGWLEPLLARIKEKRSAVLCPEIDNISDKTMRYDGTGAFSVGGFWWALHFGWDPINKAEQERRKSSTDPIRSPTMAGGLFAVNREYFFEIGAYDEGMEVWGGENLEISFRVWMCGGSLEFIPCSRVGHIFRGSHPYTFPGNKDTHGINSVRLAEVWMDDYKRLFYQHRPELLKVDYGDISSRVALRKRLGCHSFRWYLQNVFPTKYIIDEQAQAWGSVYNEHTGLALDLLGKDEKLFLQVGVYGIQRPGSSQQLFSLSNWNELRREKKCFQVRRGESTVTMEMCHDDHNNAEQKWAYDKESGKIQHVTSGKCLDAQGLKNSDLVLVKACSGKPSQAWTFQHHKSER